MIQVDLNFGNASKKEVFSMIYCMEGFIFCSLSDSFDVAKWNIVLFESLLELITFLVYDSFCCLEGYSFWFVSFRRITQFPAMLVGGMT